MYRGGSSTGQATSRLPRSARWEDPRRGSVAWRVAASIRLLPAIGARVAPRWQREQEAARWRSSVSRAAVRVRGELVLHQSAAIRSAPAATSSPTSGRRHWATRSTSPCRARSSGPSGGHTARWPRGGGHRPRAAAYICQALQWVSGHNDDRSRLPDAETTETDMAMLAEAGGLTVAEQFDRLDADEEDDITEGLVG